MALLSVARRGRDARDELKLLFRLQLRRPDRDRLSHRYDLSDRRIFQGHDPGVQACALPESCSWPCAARAVAMLWHADIARRSSLTSTRVGCSLPAVSGVVLEARGRQFVHHIVATSGCVATMSCAPFVVQRCVERGKILLDPKTDKSKHTVQPHAKTGRRKRPGRRRGTSAASNACTGHRTDTYNDVQRARLRHAHGGVRERCGVRGVRATPAHSAGARVGAARAAAGRTAAPRAAERPGRRCGARARRCLDERLDAAAGLPGGRRAARHARRHRT